MQVSSSSFASRDIIQAIKCGDCEFLKRQHSIADAKDMYGRPLLSIAAEAGQCEVVDLLIQLGADICAKDSIGRQAVHWAAAAKQDAMMKLLIRKKADVVSPDNEGRTVLSLWSEACAQGDSNDRRAVVPSIGPGSVSTSSVALPQQVNAFPAKSAGNACTSRGPASSRDNVFAVAPTPKQRRYCRKMAPRPDDALGSSPALEQKAGDKPASPLKPGSNKLRGNLGKSHRQAPGSSKSVARARASLGKGKRRDKKYDPFTQEEENYVRQGVKCYKGTYAMWIQILKHYPFREGRTAVDIKDKWRNIQKKEGK
eukprot:TRINITY_DN88115_c0_g1_i1.p1 TRINITY_DN88115_c0_g1~~TRINITY_DN88115_c0_g1_i1.p1  ORF type:complete len:312 (-),score=50.70 TRINITY_DN88115_c0_g1_i1:38-973(-)